MFGGSSLGIDEGSCFPEEPDEDDSIETLGSSGLFLCGSVKYLWKMT